jgi:predicted esterase
MSRWGWIILSVLVGIAPLRAAPATTTTQAATPSFDGLWLTNLGLMDLQPAQDRMKGRYALMGVSRLTGTVTERKLEFTYKSFTSGEGIFQLSADGKRFTGKATSAGAKKSFDWRGRRADEFVRHAKLVAGKLVDGSTRGLLTYTVRAPEGYQRGDQKKWPTILILHGSNMNSKAYVNTIAAAWPDIGKDFLILGINGETPSDIGPDPRFNYTYVDYVGRSTFKGFPGTDRESPALVAEALDELVKVYPIGKIFVGGHSQGGFLTYSLLMNFPEKFAGAFPNSAGVIFQCEPKAYEDE